MAVVIASAVVGTALVLIKTWHPAGEVYRTVIGMVMWPFEVPGSVMRGDGVSVSKGLGELLKRTDDDSADSAEAAAD